MDIMDMRGKETTYYVNFFYHKQIYYSINLISKIAIENWDELVHQHRRK